MEIDLTTLSLLAGVGGTVFGVVTGIIRFCVDYLESRYGNKMTPAEQSAKCGFDHERIAELTRNQNEHIAELLHQNGEQIKALRDANHNSELRHQVVVNHLDRIERRVADIVRVPQNTP